MKTGSLRELAERCRSYRRFEEEERIGEENLIDLVDLARLTSSASNAHALKFRLDFPDDEC